MPPELSESDWSHTCILGGNSMLVPMANMPDGVENVKLLNNLGYLGADVAPGAPAAGGTGDKKSASQQAQDWITTLTQGAAAVAPLLRKQPKNIPPKYDPKVNPDWNQGGDDNTTTYLLIAGGVLLGGVILYKMFGGKKKGRK
jgi:hypothetical protein